MATINVIGRTPDENGQSIKERFCALLDMEHMFASPQWPLPNMKEIREVDYWWYRASYSHRAEMWVGQIKIAERDPHPNNTFGNPHWGNVFVYLDDHGTLEGGGHAILYTYNWMNYRKGEPGNKDPNFPAVRYFTWQKCLHEFVETGPLARRHRGWHEYTCTKCKAQHTVDSGD